MSSKSYFYNKHPSRSKSYYGKKRIYGSAYQPGQTTKYQRYGRTMRLDPSYINIPRSLPTRQSQLRQVEELRKAGLIPDPVPVPVGGNMMKITFAPSSDASLSSIRAQLVLLANNLNISLSSIKSLVVNYVIYNASWAYSNGYDNLYQLRVYEYDRHSYGLLFKNTASATMNLNAVISYNNLEITNSEVKSDPPMGCINLQPGTSSYPIKIYIGSNPLRFVRNSLIEANPNNGWYNVSKRSYEPISVVEGQDKVILPENHWLVKGKVQVDPNDSSRYIPEWNDEEDFNYKSSYSSSDSSGIYHYIQSYTVFYEANN